MTEDDEAAAADVRGRQRSLEDKLVSCGRFKLRDYVRSEILEPPFQVPDRGRQAMGHGESGREEDHIGARHHSRGDHERGGERRQGPDKLAVVEGMYSYCDCFYISWSVQARLRDSRILTLRRESSRNLGPTPSPVYFA